MPYPLAATRGISSIRVIDPIRPLLAMTWDNNDLTIYSVVRAMMAAYGWKGTIFPTSANNFHPSSGAITQAQIGELVGDGWEVGSHTVNHIQLTTVDEATKISECAGSKQAIIDAGFGTPRAIAYPVGSYDAATISVVQQYYDYGLTIDAGYNVEAEARYAITRMGRALSSAQAPWDDVKSMLTECAARVGFYIYYSHGAQVDTYSDTVEMLAEFLAMARQLNYQVLPFSQAMDLWKIRAVPLNKNVLQNPSLNYLTWSAPTTYPDFWKYQGTDANAICTPVAGDGMYIATAVQRIATHQYTLNSVESPLKRDQNYRASVDVIGTVDNIGSGVRITVEGNTGWTLVGSAYQKGFSGTRTLTVDFSIPAAQAVLPNKIKFYWNNTTGSVVVKNWKLYRI